MISEFNCIWKNSSKAQNDGYPFGINYNSQLINIYGNVSLATNKIANFVEIGGTDEHPTEIQSGTIISAFSFICPGTRIGKDVFIGPRTTFTNDRYPPSKKREGHTQQWKGVTVEDEAVIGAGCILLPGITIGKGAKIGAGSVVTKDVPAGEVWVGVPSRPLHIPEVEKYIPNTGWMDTLSNELDELYKENE